MSKLPCPCGNIISDSTQDKLEQGWGYLVKNKDWFDYQEEVSKVLSGLFESYKNGVHIEWLEKNCPVYSDQPLESIISDILSRLDQNVGVGYAECTKCGGILIQKSSGKNEYKRYLPE